MYIIDHFDQKTQKYDKGLRVPYRNVIYIIDVLLFVMFCILVIMLAISVRMLRRFIIDHTTHKANEKTACLHFIMLFSLYFASAFNELMALFTSVKVI